MTNKIKFRRALASAEAPGYEISNVIDGKTDKGGWTASILPVLKNAEQRAVFELEDPLPSFPVGTRMQFTIFQKHDGKEPLDCNAFGRFRLSATTNALPLKVDPLTATQRKLLAIAPTDRTPEQQRELFNVFRHQGDSFASINAKIDSGKVR